jgi:hypothetical protein
MPARDRLVRFRDNLWNLHTNTQQFEEALMDAPIRAPYIFLLNARPSSSFDARASNE